MGCFTTVIHNNHHYQFNTGDDSCEVFNIGDDVPWRLDSMPGRGHLLNGAYESHSGKEYPNDRHMYSDCFVIIRDHKIFDIVDRKDGDEFAESEDEAAKRFGICPIQRHWWTERAWELSRQIDEFYERRRKPYSGNPLLRPLSEPLYDQEPDPEVCRLSALLKKEPIPGQNSGQSK
jgi:hypothetical protein